MSHLTLYQIISTVGRVTGVPSGQIVSPSKIAALVDARHLVWWVAGRNGIRNRDLASRWGVHPSTVSYGIERVETAPAERDGLAEKRERLRAMTAAKPCSHCLGSGVEP